MNVGGMSWVTIGTILVLGIMFTDIFDCTVRIIHVTHCTRGKHERFVFEGTECMHHE